MSIEDQAYKLERANRKIGLLKKEIDNLRNVIMDGEDDSSKLAERIQILEDLIEEKKEPELKPEPKPESDIDD